MAEVQIIKHKDIDATVPDCEGNIMQTAMGGLRCSVEGCRGTMQRSDLDKMDSILQPGGFFSFAIVAVTPDA